MLTDTDRAMLDLERQWWQRPGSKEQAIRDRMGLDPARYYQCLSRLLDRPEALAADPVTIGRLRRLRDSRALTRRARAG